MQLYKANAAVPMVEYSKISGGGGGAKKKKNLKKKRFWFITKN
jgi:hypothetical protein